MTDKPTVWVVVYTADRGVEDVQTFDNANAAHAYIEDLIDGWYDKPDLSVSDPDCDDTWENIDANTQVNVYVCELHSVHGGVGR